MAKETFIVAYGGDDGAVVDFAAQRAKRRGARVFIVHVLEWSPYSFLTPQELEERHRRRKEELSRAEKAVVGPAVATLEAAGVEVASEVRYGSVVDLVIEIALREKASMIFCGRTAGSGVSVRMFGSVSLGLAQSAPVPTVIVP